MTEWARAENLPKQDEGHPEYSDPVLVYIDDLEPYQEIAYYDFRRKQWRSDSTHYIILGVTHWRPLSPPPDADGPGVTDGRRPTDGGE